MTFLLLRAAYEKARELDLSVLFHTELEIWLSRQQLAAYIVPQQRPRLVCGPPDQRDAMVRWTDAGEDRFYVCEAYDRNKRQFRQT
jgi:hypothetical protein